MGAVFLIAAVACGLAFAFRSGTMDATAGSPCVEAVMLDWANDGRIDRAYPATCYYAAIDSLPEDLRVYSSAQDDLRRALQSSSRRSP